MQYKDIVIPTTDYLIKASLHIPTSKTDTGIILAHGGFINRQSLSRKTYSLSKYLCRNLNATVITPDLRGETIHHKPITFNNYTEIINHTINYLAEEYNTDTIMGFGHSMGCHILAQTAKENKHLAALANYGGFIEEPQIVNRIWLFRIMTKILKKFNKSIDLRKYFKYFMDEHTVDYLFNVMCTHDQFHSENYYFKWDFQLISELFDAVDNYYTNLKSCGSPVLLLFGSLDSITLKTKSKFYDGYIDDNIQVKHISGYSHVSPCLESVEHIEKLFDVTSFFEQRRVALLENQMEVFELQTDAQPLYEGYS